MTSKGDGLLLDVDLIPQSLDLFNHGPGQGFVARYLSEEFRRGINGVKSLNPINCFDFDGNLHDVYFQFGLLGNHFVKTQ